VSGPLIELADVRKDFRVRGATVHAVDGISLAIEPGAVVGYIGPNGAGKSTTVKMLTGVLVPSSGRVRVAGLDPTRERIALAKRIGVLFGQRVQLWWDLPLIDSFELLRHIYRIPAERYAANLARMREVLELDPFLRTPVRQLSLGQRVRGELAGVMLHDPEILFLDEPTIGLDVVAKERVRQFLQSANQDRGVTILLTTHDLADIERLCERILIIDRGRLIYDGDLPALLRRFGGRRIVVVDLVEASAPLRIAEAEVVRIEGPRQWIAFDGERTSASRVIASVSQLATVRDLTIEEPEIEAVVREIYAGTAKP
jgi:ABC-2 type transport system ATP-binding protein